MYSGDYTGQRHSTLNQITLNQNCVVPPTGQATPTVATYVPLSVFGPALDLTGVTFQSTVRQSLTSFTNLLLATTGNGLMINGGANGTFGWNVPSGEPNWPIGLTQVGGLAAVVDVQASDISGSIVDLTTLSGPIPLIVTLGPVATTLLGSTMVRINSQ